MALHRLAEAQPARPVGLQPYATSTFHVGPRGMRGQIVDGVLGRVVCRLESVTTVSVYVSLLNKASRQARPVLTKVGLRLG